MVSSLDTLQFIQLELDEIEQMMLSQVEEYHPDLKTALSAILSSGGKRIRPRLILLIGRLLKANSELLVILATSIELLHTATLVHDDLIDGSPLRRGIPTLNSKWSPSATVLTGDFLFASALDIASKTNSIKVISLISRCLMTIVNGEVDQLFSGCRIVDTDDYFRRIYAKTASLFETSTHSAAVISNVDARQVELMRRFGYELGMAFQVVDDILDYTGEESTVGKPVGGDLRQGLITLPMLYYMESNPDDPAVQSILAGNCILSENEVQRLVSMVAKSDAILRSHKVAVNFASKAESYIMEFPDTPERDALVEITRYIIDRKK